MIIGGGSDRREVLEEFVSMIEVENPIKVSILGKGRKFDIHQMHPPRK